MAIGDLNLRQRRKVSSEIAKEYSAWKRKLHREPSEAERRQIVAIGFSKAHVSANPEMISEVCGAQENYLTPLGPVSALGPAAAIPMFNNPTRAIHHGDPDYDERGADIDMFQKGYRYKIVPNSGGEPLYVKTLMQIGPVMRMYPTETFKVGTLHGDGSVTFTKPNPSLAASLAGAVVGSVVANAMGNPIEIVETVHGTWMILVNGFQWGAPYDASGAGSVTFKTKRAAQATAREIAAGVGREPDYDDGMKNNPGVACPVCHETVSSFKTLSIHLRKAHRNPGGEREDFGLEGRPCSACGGPLQFLGTLGTADHYQCRNCGMTASATRASDVRDGYLRREFGYGENPQLYAVFDDDNDAIVSVPLDYKEAKEMVDHLNSKLGKTTAPRYMVIKLDTEHRGPRQNPLTTSEAYRIREMERTRVAQSQRAYQGGDRTLGQYYDGLAQGMRTIRQDFRAPGVSYTPNPLLMTVVGNPGQTPYQENGRHRRSGRKQTVTLEEFARRVKASGDPALWQNFLAKIRGYQKWSHGTLPSKVTIEQVDVPGVKGMMIMFDMGKQPDSTYIMPDGTKRKGAWKHPWETMPDMKGDGQAGIIVTKLKGKNKLTDFLHG